tara:strand:- start:11519 stop:11929 length:411 start_codon:yes stop_codon:yes gene_type:complete
MIFKTEKLPEFRSINDFRPLLTWLSRFFMAYAGDTPLKRKLIELGPWDAASANIVYPGGGSPNFKTKDLADYPPLNLTNVFSLRFILFKDDGTVGEYKTIDDFFIRSGTTLIIRGGFGSDYSSTTLNRGYIIVEYI